MVSDLNPFGGIVAMALKLIFKVHNKTMLRTLNRSALSLLNYWFVQWL